MKSQGLRFFIFSGTLFVVYMTRNLNYIRMKKYLINEIFYSLQGEGKHTGHPFIFIRFSNCNLKCSFCDTEFKKVNFELTKEELMDALTRHNLK